MSGVEFGGWFGDRRLARRGEALVRRMSERRTCIVRGLSDGRAEEVGYGRFLGHAAVTPASIFDAAGQAARRGVEGRHVLAIQDSSTLTWLERQPGSGGLGPSATGAAPGLQLHAVLAVEAATGAVLGLAGGHVWTRGAQKVTPHAQRALSARESQRWLDGAAQASRLLAAGAARVTVVADRESDIYSEWALLPARGVELLTRSMQDRVLAGGGTLYGAAGALAVADRYEIEVRARPGRARRTARVEVRFGGVEIARPKTATEADLAGSVRLQLVEARETSAPADGSEPILWRLLTTHAVDDAAGARQVIEWYRRRWQIEQFFRALKEEGLRIEAARTGNAHGLMNLVAMACVAATAVMQLVQGRDGALDRPASDVVDAAMLLQAATLCRKLEGKTAAQKNPHPHASLAWLAWIVARLGGWNGYASYPPPGPKTMSRGWHRFLAHYEGWALHAQLNDV